MGWKTSHGDLIGATGLNWKAPPEYTVWKNMRSRCGKPCHKQYKHYGGRGINVCDRWQHSYNNFLADMGRRPTPKHTIHRIDNDRGYEPDNVKWATYKEQRTNVRRLKAHTQSPYWMKHTWGTRHGKTGYTFVVPKNTPVHFKEA